MRLHLLKCFCVLALASLFAHAQPNPVIITQQPSTLIDAVARQSTNLTVEAAGSDLQYSWHHNGLFLPAGTNATLSLINITTNQAGTYYVFVSNSINSVRSSNVLVRVVPDTFGPRILSATVLTEHSNRVTVSFDEGLLRLGPSGWTNHNKYIIREVATGQRGSVTQIFIAIGSGLMRLTLASNFDRSKRYELCLSNVADSLTNYIAMNSCVPIAFEVATNVITFASLWSFYCGGGEPPPDWNEFRTPPPPALWCNGQAMFYDWFLPPDAPCTIPQTILSGSPYYFRKSFTVSTNALGIPVTAALGRVLPSNGGAIVYLNGTEVLRTTPVFDQPDCWTNTIAVGHLLTRTNVLAVYLPEGLFDAALTLRYAWATQPSAGNVFLRYSNHSPTELRLFWTNGTGLALEYVNALGDQWRELQPPSTNLLVNKSAPARFYRLNKRH